MKTHHHHQKQLKTPPRPLFSCGIFRYCTTHETVLSPTTPTPPPPPHTSNLPPPPQPSDPPPPFSDPQPPSPPPLTTKKQSSSQPDSESSSSSTSQSFTQWRFPVSNSPVPNQHPNPNYPPPESGSSHDPANPNPTPPPPPPPPPYTNLAELFHVAELQFSTGSSASRLPTLYLLERSLVPNPPADGGGDPTCPPAVMREIVSLLKDKEGAKSATKVLLALCLSEGNRHVAVEAGAVVEVVEALTELEGAAAERALAALELLCTVAEGVAEIRGHALAVPMLVEMMGTMAGRGKECAISVLAAIFGGGGGGGGGGEVVEPGVEVGRALMMALQGECSTRGRRKGTQLLKVLQENGRLDLTEPLDLYIMQG